MKFVNPMGREPGSGVQPRACTCTSGYQQLHQEIRCC